MSLAPSVKVLRCERVFENLEFERANKNANMMKRKIDWLKKPNLKIENSYILTHFKYPW
jgi:hypothetical protein